MASSNLDSNPSFLSHCVTLGRWLSFSSFICKMEIIATPLMSALNTVVILSSNLVGGGGSGRGTEGTDVVGSWGTVSLGGWHLNWELRIENDPAGWRIWRNSFLDRGDGKSKGSGTGKGLKKKKKRILVECWEHSQAFPCASCVSSSSRQVP